MEYDYEFWTIEEGHIDTRNANDYENRKSLAVLGFRCTKHRLDGPSTIYYDKRNRKDRELWEVNGKLHREDGPAKIHYDSKSNITHQSWHWHDLTHREDGPAYIYYNNDQSVYVEEWSIYGKLHRLDGPAFIQHRRGEVKQHRIWYFNNRRVTLYRLREMLNGVDPYSKNGHLLLKLLMGSNQPTEPKGI